MSTPSKTYSSGEFKKEETLACVLSWNTDWFEKHKGAHSSGGVSENLDKNSGKKRLLCQRDAWCPSELHPLAIFSLLQEGEPDPVYSFSLEALKLKKEEILDCVLSWNTDKLANPKEGCRSDDSAGEIKSDSCPEPVYKWPKKNSCSDDSSSTDEEDLTSIDTVQKKPDCGEQSDARRELRGKRKKRCRDRRGQKKKQKVAKSGKCHSSIEVGSLEDPESNKEERLLPKYPTPMLNEDTEDIEEGPMDTTNDEDMHQPQRDDAGSETSSSYRSNGANVKREDDSPGHYFLTDSQVTTEAEKNEYGNIPKKAQSDETDSVDSIEHAIEGSSATGTYGVLGGKLSTKSHGFTLHIPPGALEADEKISLRVLTEIPNGLTLKEDELLVSHGFQCYPSGLRFKKPAKLIIPHCALVTAPNKVQTILYSLNQSGAPKRLPDSSNFICSVQERWLEVSVSHFSGGFISFIWNSLFLKGIIVSCMSFLPRLLPHTRKPLLEVRFAKKPHGQRWNDVHALNDPISQPVKGDDDEIVFGKGTLTVACQLGEKSWMKRKPIQYSDMSSTNVKRYFQLDLTEENDETLVTLEVGQTSTQTIQFNTRFQGIYKETTAEQDAPSPPTEEIPSDEQKVTDANILTLARLLLPNLWCRLHVALGIDYSTAEGIRERIGEITEHYIHLLQKWKAASTRTRSDLNAILDEIGAGELVTEY